MNAKQRNSALVAAIIAGVLSLPLTWLTLHNVQLSGPFGTDFGMRSRQIAMDINGFNGHVSILFKTPLWFIVCVAICASILQLLRTTQSFEIPKAAQWATAIIGVIWVSAPGLLGLASGNASLGIGWPVGIFCAVVPLVCLIQAQRENRASEYPVRSPDEGQESSFF